MLLATGRRLAFSAAVVGLLSLQACAVAPATAPADIPIRDAAGDETPAPPKRNAGLIVPGADEAPVTGEQAAAAPPEPTRPEPAAATPEAAAPHAGPAAGHAEADRREHEPPPAMLDLTESPADLWDRIRNGFGLPDLDDPLVRVHEEWYAGRTDYLQRLFERCRPYLHYWVDEADKRGLPTELALLPMIESACNPMAVSRSKATGPWQFMAGTGRKFGLQQDAWYDGRRDLIAATNAAFDYLETLYDMFGSWYLALAGYNAGEGTVGRAIARNEAKGLRADYVSLQLPGETRNYVPKLQAIKNIVAHPENFGVRLDAIPNEPHFTTVKVPQLLDLGEAARLAEIPLTDLVSLNPAFNRPVVRVAGRAELVLPAEAAEVFLANLERHGGSSRWQTYRPKRGERFDTIAKRHGMSLAQLKQINDIPSRQRTSKGEPLLVPARNAPAPAAVAAAPAPSTPANRAAPSQQQASTARIHVVGRGDTLFSIARKYGTNIQQLKDWNKLPNSRLSLGQKLVVQPPQVAAAPPAPRAELRPEAPAPAPTPEPAAVKRYVVQPGDTLYSIARQFKVDIGDIERPSAGALRAGETLMIPVAFVR